MEFLAGAMSKGHGGAAKFVLGVLFRLLRGTHHILQGRFEMGDGDADGNLGVVAGHRECDGVAINQESRYELLQRSRMLRASAMKSCTGPSWNLRNAGLSTAWLPVPSAQPSSALTTCMWVQTEWSGVRVSAGRNANR
jgi:hypothetical protein